MSSSQSVGASNDRIALACEEVLDLSTVTALHESLLAAISAGGDLEVRAHLVARVDTANLQLLCAAAQELRARGRTLRLTDPSPPFLLAARRLGLAGALGLDLTETATSPATAAKPAQRTEM